MSTELGTGGGEAPLDIGAAVAEIAGDLGVGDDAPAGDKGPPPPSDASAADASPEVGAVGDEGGAAPAATATPPSDETPAQPGAEPPPDAWRKEAKAIWDKLPAEAQAEIRKREGDFANGISQYRQMAEVGQQYAALIEPIRGNLERANIRPSELLPQLIGAWTVMANGQPEQKAEMFRTLARDAGLDLAALAQGQAAAAPQAQEMQRLQSEIANLRRELTSVRAGQEQVQLSELEKRVIAMRDDGKHPHFNDVIMDMKTLLDSGVAQDLEEAYDQAVYRNPATRAKEIARAAEEASRKATSAAAARAAKAAKAAAPNVRATGVSTRAGGGFVGSIDDTLAETLAEIQSRSAA